VKNGEFALLRSKEHNTTSAFRLQPPRKKSKQDDEIKVWSHKVVNTSTRCSFERSYLNPYTHVSIRPNHTTSIPTISFSQKPPTPRNAKGTQPSKVLLLLNHILHIRRSLIPSPNPLRLPAPLLSLFPNPPLQRRRPRIILPPPLQPRNLDLPATLHLHPRKTHDTPYLGGSSNWPIPLRSEKFALSVSPKRRTESGEEVF
jgi:hypothetical protein